MLMAGRRMKTEKTEMIKVRCEVCDNHCEIEAEVQDGEVLDISGNGCMKGFIFAQQNIRETKE